MRPHPAAGRAIRRSARGRRGADPEPSHTGDGARLLRARRGLSLSHRGDDVRGSAAGRSPRQGGSMNGTVLVTGAGGGIGLATVSCLVKDGLDVAASDVKDTVPELPPEPRYVPFDLLDGDPATLMATFEDTGLDYLVNTAGVAMSDRDGSVLD